MFFVFNREKIYSYIIAVCTVIVLFAVSEVYIKDESYIETSSNIANEVIIKDNKIVNEINNVE